MWWSPVDAADSWGSSSQSLSLVLVNANGLTSCCNPGSVRGSINSFNANVQWCVILHIIILHVVGLFLEAHSFQVVEDTHHLGQDGDTDQTKNDPTLEAQHYDHPTSESSSMPLIWVFCNGVKRSAEMPASTARRKAFHSLKTCRQMSSLSV